jgi:hypothetical protein
MGRPLKITDQITPKEISTLVRKQKDGQALRLLKASSCLRYQSIETIQNKIRLSQMAEDL